MSDSAEHMEVSDMAAMAAQFVNSTGRHIFLTGKAGTGKTTFLQNLAKATPKSFLIVAPTGIAALNAGGVTIHSQFLFPMGSYIPQGEIPAAGNYFNAKSLLTRHPINSVRKQVLRDIDLLIIDEVSMLRADILDAIDERLKSARRVRNKSFGGVQLLLIGDMFQLPPIVRDQEWAVLRKHYRSMHFFSAQSLQQDGYTYLELSKVYRQHDEKFIGILNNLRNNECTQADIDTLNAHYRADADEIENTITLVTHNRQADEINQRELDKLEEKTYSYSAKVTGDFPDSMYPLLPDLTFKVGAQVMFVKNDHLENQFYNGKLGKISDLGKSHIEVTLADSKKKLVIEPMLWQNKKYTLDGKKEINEEVVGKFEQYPIKLAWAVTVHKSQGLTFDRAVIDVGRAFAPGQVYVALSRLRSLEGLTLRTKITQSTIATDSDVVSFQKTRDLQGDLIEILKSSQSYYLQEALHKIFNFDVIGEQLAYIQYKTGGKMEFADADMREALPNMKRGFDNEKENTRKFRNQISILLRDGEYEKLRTRVEKGSAYYLDLLFSTLYSLLLHKTGAEQFARTKTYVNLLSEVDQLIMRAIEKLQNAVTLTASILDNEEMEPSQEARRKRLAKREMYLTKIEAHIRANPRKGASKTGKRKKTKGPTQKGATFQETYALVKEGLTIKQIAVKRSLTESTIEIHVAKGIAAGEVKIKKFLDEESIDEIELIMAEKKSTELADVFAHFKGKYSYGQLRMVRAHMALNNRTPD